MLSAYLTASEVADEIGITTSGVYKLIQRGKLPAVRRSERGLRVSRLALDAYQRRVRGEAAPIPQVKYSSKTLDQLRVEFEAEAGVSPAEWERRWASEEIEDSAENMKLTVWASGLLLYTESNRLSNGMRPTRSTPVPNRAAA